MAKVTAKNRKSPKKSPKAGNEHTTASKTVEDGFTSVASLIPPGSPQRTAATVAAAAVGALAAAALFGVFPAALAGAAGYLAYRATGRGE